MKINEIINNHKGLVFFYPFSGTHLGIINPLHNSLSCFNGKILFVCCSFKGPQQKPHITGTSLRNIEIEPLIEKLDDEQFDAGFYAYGHCELVLVKSEVFKFIDYLQEQGVDLFKMNLIIDFTSGIKNILNTLIPKFHPIRANEEDESITKILVVNNDYLDEVRELFSQTTSYQFSFEIEERESDDKLSRNEKYTIFFEEKGFYLAANILRRI
jgi:hypothetical protein